MAMHNKNENDTQKRKKTDKRGFYAALAICVAAIGIAAWSTYDTMTDFLEPANVVSEQKQEPEKVSESVTMDDPEPTVEEGHGHATASAVETEGQPEEVPVEIVAAPTEVPVKEPADTPQPAEKPAETAAPVSAYTESDRFIRPVKSSEVLAVFSEMPVYSETMRDYRMHTGVDYKAERGETVHAAANGIVKSTHTDMLLGNMIVIDHGDAELSYCGLGETFLVKPGEVVEAGQDIGSITAAPFESAMEPHLHLEAAQHGKNIDPETLFE